jgi:hypothetical protein
VPPWGARVSTGDLERADRLTSWQRRGHRHSEDPPGPPLQIVIFSLRHGENGIDAIRTVTAPPRGIMGPSTGSNCLFFRPTSCAFTEHALNEAPAKRMPEQPSKVVWECDIERGPQGERYLFPLRRRQSYSDQAIAVAIFLRQTNCLTAIFASPKVDTPDLAGDGLWHVLELDAPDALIGCKVSVDTGERPRPRRCSRRGVARACRGTRGALLDKLFGPSLRTPRIALMRRLLEVL